MKASKAAEKIVRNTLGIVLMVMAINAFLGGYYGMAGAKDVPKEWLEGSPFTSYFIPGLILLLCVGGSSLMAAIAVFRKYARAPEVVATCAIIILIWLSVQIGIIVTYHGCNRLRQL